MSVYLLPFESNPEPAFTGPKVWLVSGMDRILASQWQDLMPINTIYAAKGEYEPFQLVVRAPQGGLSDVTVNFSDFQDTFGNHITPTLYREHFVYADDVKRDYFDESNYRATNIAEPAGWYPDALIPFANPATAQALDGELKAQPFKVKAKRNEIIWVDVFVPREASSGTYTSQYSVNTQEGQMTGTITLVVWDFVLPLRPSLNSTFPVWYDKKKETFIELLKHKLMPDAVPPPIQAELIKDWGLKAVKLPFWSGANINNCAMNPAPSVEEFKYQTQQQHSELMVYVYASDEISHCSELDNRVKEWARNTHLGGSKNLIVMAPRPSLYEDNGQPVVDIWVVDGDQLMHPVTSIYIQDVQTLGQEVWSYTALIQNTRTPKWAINFTGVNHRIMPGFLNQLYGLKGSLYWQVDDWSNDAWFKIKRNPEYPAGEGMLMYPGGKVGLNGAVASIRLKWIREGVEDYEYIEILKSLGQKEKAMTIIRTVAQDWYRWNKDPRVLEAARLQLAQAILEVQGN